MIIGISSTDVSWVEDVVRLLRKIGYLIVDLESLRFDWPSDIEEEFSRIWGRDWLIRLARQQIPDLENVAICGIHTGDEVDGAAKLEFTMSTPVRFLYKSATESAGTALSRYPGMDCQNLELDSREFMLNFRRLPMGWTRPTWDEYFMRIATIVARRSDCTRRQVAAVIVKDRRIIATGSTAAPKGVTNCGDGGCERCVSDVPSGTRLDECICLHGEENAIVQAAYHGISVKDSILYSTTSPCLLCAKKIINSGIVEVVYNQNYPLNSRAQALLSEGGVVLRHHRSEL